MNDYPAVTDLVEMALAGDRQGLLGAWGGADGHTGKKHGMTGSWIEACTTSGQKVPLSALVRSSFFEREAQLHLVVKDASGVKRSTLPREAYGAAAVMLAAITVGEAEVRVAADSWMLEAAASNPDAKLVVDLLLAQREAADAKAARDALAQALRERSWVREAGLEEQLSEEVGIDLEGLEDELAEKLFLLSKAGGITLTAKSRAVTFSASLQHYRAELAPFRKDGTLDEALEDVWAGYLLHQADPLAWVLAGNGREQRRKRAIGVENTLLTTATKVAREALRGALQPTEPFLRVFWIAENADRLGQDEVDAAWREAAPHERILLTRLYQKFGVTLIERSKKKD